MKIAAPQLLKVLTDSNLEIFEEDGLLEDVRLFDISADSFVFAGADIRGVVIEKCTLHALQLSRLTARDLQVQNSDISAGSLAGAGINRSQFINCRMSGIDFSQSRLHDVTFRSCKMDVANFRFGDLRRVEFIDCQLNEADFLNATLTDVRFESCTLDRTVFDQTKCKKVDLRTSDITTISGWQSLKGVTIDSVQLTTIAPILAAVIGLNVRND